MDFFAAELEKCNQVENLEVNTQLLDSEGAQEQMRLDMAGGDSPGGIIHTTPQLITEFADPGWLYPLDDLVEKYWVEYRLNEILDTAWEGVLLHTGYFRRIGGICIILNRRSCVYIRLRNHAWYWHVVLPAHASYHSNGVTMDDA